MPHAHTFFFFKYCFRKESEIPRAFLKKKESEVALKSESAVMTGIALSGNAVLVVVKGKW